MPYHWQLAFSTVPLALYLYLLAAWHGGKHPKVVSGPADFALLVLGIGGFALFGPLGQTLARTFFGRPTTLGWLTLASGMLLVALMLARGNWRRLVVYNIDPPTLEATLRDALGQGPGGFVRTLRGFEDPARGRGVAFQAYPRARTATIDAFGSSPEVLIHDLSGRLRTCMRDVQAPPTRVAWLFLGGSALTLAVTLGSWVLHDPGARAALRLLIKRLP